MILRDTTSQSGAQSAPPKSWSHTCNAGDNRGLIVITATLSGTATGVTYNGSAMTSMLSTTAGVVNLRHWFLAAPSTGSNTITVTCSAGSLAVSGCAVSVFNIKQTGQPNATAVSANNNTSQTTQTTTITPSVAGCVVVDNYLDAVSRISCLTTPGAVGTGLSLQYQIGCNASGNSGSTKFCMLPTSTNMTETAPSSVVSWHNAVAYEPVSLIFPKTNTGLGGT